MRISLWAPTHALAIGLIFSQFAYSSPHEMKFDRGCRADLECMLLLCTYDHEMNPASKKDIYSAIVYHHIAQMVPFSPRSCPLPYIALYHTAESHFCSLQHPAHSHPQLPLLHLLATLLILVKTRMPLSWAIPSPAPDPTPSSLVIRSRAPHSWIYSPRSATSPPTSSCWPA